MEREQRIRTLVSRCQGAYFALTGLWAILDIDSFQRVTGPKTDLWLVKAVGMLVLVIGLVLIVAARPRALSSELVLLGGGSALGLAVIDIVYVAAGTIAPIYLFDAAAELVFVGLWILARPRR
jgi:hypothetical protein